MNASVENKSKLSFVDKSSTPVELFVELNLIVASTHVRKHAILELVNLVRKIQKDYYSALVAINQLKVS